MSEVFCELETFSEIIDKKSFYINNLLPRNDIQIINKNILCDFEKDDFHYVVYYLDLYKAKIIIRRLDKDTGWANNVMLKIYDISDNNKSQLLSIGSSNKNIKILNIFTNIELHQIYYKPQKIPKIIIQTTSNKNIKNILHYNSIQTFIELNPEYEYRILDDDESRLFIKNNFDIDILVAYDMLIPGSFKADLFRYCYLYINGGCYFDCKQILRHPIRTFVDENDDFLVCKDIGPGFFNAVILSSEKNELIMDTIERVKYKIFNFYKIYNFMNKKQYNTQMLSLTGPNLLYETIKDRINNNNIKFQHKYLDKHLDLSNCDYKKLVVTHNDNIIITKQFASYVNSNHYPGLWCNNEVVYKNQYILNQYKFYIYPHNYLDTFIFYIFNEKLLIIERIDKNIGWGSIHKLKIIDEINNITIIEKIESSNRKFKLTYFQNFEFNIEYNYIESFEIIDNQYNDTFDINIILQNNETKLIVIRNDANEGWGQDLKLKILVKHTLKNYIIHVGSSIEQVAIRNFIF
jgi:mannosyltransferase OCH1-like enzyme